MTTFFKSTLVLTTLAVFFGFSSTSAIAANVDLKVKASFEYSSDTYGSRSAIAYLNPKACRGHGRIYLRTRSNTTKWNRVRVVSPCKGYLTVSKPQVTFDPRTKSVVVVWSQYKQGRNKKTGIYFRQGKKWGTKMGPLRMVAATPKAVGPVPVTGAAYNGTVWIANTPNVVNGGKLKTEFKVAGYNERTGKLLKKNVATRRGTYYIDLAPEFFCLYASKKGLLVGWQLMDAGGKPHKYYASSSWKGRSASALSKPSAPVAGDRVTTFVGDTGDFYSIAEVQSLVNGTDSVYAYKWNVKSKSFVSMYRDASGKAFPFAVLESMSNPFLKAASVAMNVDKQEKLYVAYERRPEGVSDRNGGMGDCEVLEVRSMCYRGTSPAGPTPVFVIRKIDLRNPAAQQYESSRFAFPFSPRQPGGDSILEWFYSTKGANSLTLNKNYVTVNALQGFQNLTKNGTVSADGNYSIVIYGTSAINNPVPSVGSSLE